MKFDVLCLAICGFGVHFDDVMLFFGQDDKKKNNLKKRNLWTPPLKPEFFPPLLRKLGCAEDVPWEDSSGRTEYRVILKINNSLPRPSTKR